MLKLITTFPINPKKLLELSRKAHTCLINSPHYQKKSAEFDMKVMFLAWLLVVLVPVALGVAAEQRSHDDQQHGPKRAIPHPPHSPLRFMLVKGDDRQWLEVSYVDPHTIAFKISKSGTCSRNEQGNARIASYWWLGAETDENEAGETIAVQEYIYSKSSKCTINLRIDEVDWTQATLHEPPECSPDCHLSVESMHLRKL